MEFRLLGEIEAQQGGQLVDLGHARQRCVLVTLLVEADQVVQVDQLLDRVWGERPPTRARDSLYSYLSRLRQILPDVDIVRRSGGYVLSVDPDLVDLHRFRRLAAEARDTGDVRLFDQALALWRGEPFAGLDTPWLADVRETLNRERLAAELDRNDLELSVDRIPPADRAGRGIPIGTNGLPASSCWRCTNPAGSPAHSRCTTKPVARWPRNWASTRARS
ncbi:AfsR/SARP family transcriptional regulator [Kibdelosporangium aridum]|uniref:AfsR/SARP family transcriptional regulator n=1 Tax=Kibdelosporangium aridum TaxID=2030 RepID=UPI0035ED070F